MTETLEETPDATTKKFLDARVEEFLEANPIWFTVIELADALEVDPRRVRNILNVLLPARRVVEHRGRVWCYSHPFARMVHPGQDRVLPLPAPPYAIRIPAPSGPHVKEKGIALHVVHEQLASFGFYAVLAASGWLEIWVALPSAAAERITFEESDARLFASLAGQFGTPVPENVQVLCASAQAKLEANVLREQRVKLYTTIATELVWGPG
jgi:hypothetical protein